MGEPRNVPSVSIPEAESFGNDGIAACLAEPKEKLTDHPGIDMPGVGLVPEGEDASLGAQAVSLALSVALWHSDEDQNSLSKSQTKEAVPAEKNAPAGAGMRSCSNHGESWRYQGYSRQREVVYIGMGEPSTLRTIQLSGVYGVREAALRAIACVNFCRNLSDAELDRPPLVPWQRERGESEAAELAINIEGWRRSATMQEGGAR